MLPTHDLGQAPSPAPWAFTDGQLEALKWLGVGFMFLDHFGRLLLGFGTDSWVFAASRIAFPLFAVVLALNLAREGDRAGRAARTAGRLALWCAVAVGPSIWARGLPWMVNVLGTLALGAALCWAFAAAQAPPWQRLGAAVAAALAAHFVEFGLAGVLLVPATYLAAAQRSAGAALVAVLLLLMIAWLNGAFGGVEAFLGTVAVVPLAALVRTLPILLPRTKLTFYVVYPLHLALIGALQGVVR
ncbi:TraX family protein [Ramlibacter sp. AN1015]|uniref:TraX family protein n=1 Tax=Ramlibacter sp. AN1015 TaxID=3133428 RepID=UPI0030BADC13